MQGEKLHGKMLLRMMKFDLQYAEPKDGTNHDLSFCGHVKSGDDRQRKAKNYDVENQA